jgi:putative transposase
MSDKYAAIRAHRGQFPVRPMCEALGVSVSGYYDAVARAATPPSAHAVADERLRVHGRAVRRKSRGRYGAPRVPRELRAQGIAVATKRVARLMRDEELAGRRRRKFVRTTDSGHAEPVVPNLLGRRFGVSDHPAPGRAWCRDLTISRRARGGCSRFPDDGARGSLKRSDRPAAQSPAAAPRHTSDRRPPRRT